jgi:hypothetical protein
MVDPKMNQSKYFKLHIHLEQDLIYVVGNEEPPCEAIKHMAIGDIRPREDEVTNVVISQATDEQASVDVPESEREQTPA